MTCNFILSILFRAEPGFLTFKYQAQSLWVKGEVSGDEAKRNASLSLFFFFFTPQSGIHSRSRVHRNNPENVYTGGRFPSR